MEDPDDMREVSGYNFNEIKTGMEIEIDHIVEKYHRVKNECIKFCVTI